MNKTWIIIIVGILTLNSPLLLLSQEIKKSELIEQIGGKQYYLHTVEQGQTLYSLSRAYGLSLDEMIYENPDASQSLAVGQVLKIPVTSREQKITEELRNEDFRYIFHIVKKGETLYGISRIYEVDVADIKAANPGWENGLKTGQYIKVPMREPAPPSQEVEVQAGIEGEVYSVKAGETLYSISRKFKISIPALKAANTGLESSLRTGQKIIIPQIPAVVEPVKEEKKYIEHTVRSQETLYGIAREYRTSIDSLKAINPGLNENIFPGEVIRIPGTINPNNFITHRVQENTKIKRIASKYALSVSSMKDANPGIGNRVYSGDLLKVPVGPPPEGYDEEEEQISGEIAEESPEIVINDSIRCYHESHLSSDPIKIALMIPLYTEETRYMTSEESGKDSDPSAFKPFNFIQFYEGFLLALEESQRSGQEIRLYVYDVDEKISKTIKVLQEPALKDMDLIIGPFFRRNFKLVSNFAEMFNIMIVNPLTRRNEVLNNPNVIKIKPSRDVQPAMLASFIEKYHSDANIILIRNNKFQNTATSEDIRSRLEKILPYGVKISNNSIYELLTAYSKADTNLAPGERYDHIIVENRRIATEQLENTLADSTFFTNGINEVIYAEDSVNGLIRYASIARKNLFLVISNNEVFVPEILTRLNELKDTFDVTVVGLPEWELLNNLEIDYLLDLDVHFFTDSYYDYDDPGINTFIETFRAKYKTQPDNFAFEAYDLGRYFMGAIESFGQNCKNCLQYYRAKTLKSSFIIAPAYPAGYENVYWNFCRYRNYKIYKFPDSDFYQAN